MQEESQTQLVHRVGLRERQALPDEAAEPLAQRVVPSFNVRRQSCLFACGRVLPRGDDQLISRSR